LGYLLEFSFATTKLLGNGNILLHMGLLTLLMFFRTLKTNRTIMHVFISLAVLFFPLTVKELTAITGLSMVAGYEGIVFRSSAF
jgi:succinate-acetate transporter protein